MQDSADEEAQGTEPDLDRFSGLFEATVADIPRTTLSGLEAQNCTGISSLNFRLRGIGILETQNLDSFLSLGLMINLDLMDQELPLERRPCQGLPRVEDGIFLMEEVLGVALWGGTDIDSGLLCW